MENWVGRATEDTEDAYGIFEGSLGDILRRSPVMEDDILCESSYIYPFSFLELILCHG